MGGQTLRLIQIILPSFEWHTTGTLAIGGGIHKLCPVSANRSQLSMGTMHHMTVSHTHLHAGVATTHTNVLG